MNKLLLIVGIFGCAVLGVSAQVTVELTVDQKQFLPGEALPVAAKITNRSGQRLHLGADPGWLTFNVESVDGPSVVKLGDVPVMGEFDLESSQMAIKRVDLEPYFSLSQPGRYRILATLHIKDWAAETTSVPVSFDVINGVTLWTQDFGVPSTNSGRQPEVRTYSLIKANYLATQLRLYAQVSNPADGQVIKVRAIGGLVSFSQPEAVVDRHSRLHILYQNGARVFNYTILDPAGTIVGQEVYEYISSRPRLAVDEQGEVVVVGGTRHLKPEEMPDVKMPAEVQIPAKP